VLCRGPLRGTVTGAVAAPDATELSGLALSRRQPGVLWTHNDSGDRARVFAVRADGTLLADLDLPGAEAVDWEDIAVGPGPRGTGDALYLADTGDNGAERSSVDVYRVPEPSVGSEGGAAATGSTAPAVRFRLRYPGGPRDAEALLVDPRGGGRLVIVTKRYDGRAEVYAATRPSAGAVTTLRRVGRLDLGLGGLATAGSVSADGRVVAVRTYFGLFVWQRRAGRSLAATLRRKPCTARVSLTGEGQGEALALTRRGRSFYTVPEGPQPEIRRYAP